MDSVFIKFSIIIWVFTVGFPYTFPGSSHSFKAGIQNDPGDDLKIINQFSGCIINVINLNGFGLNLSAVFEPILLSRYFYCPKEVSILPIELLSKYKHCKTSTTTELRNHTNLVRPTVSVRNMSEVYVSQTFSKAFGLANKNRNCETNIFIHLPNYHIHQNLYKDTKIKDLSSINIDLNYKALKWKADIINTTPKYSLLLCHFKYSPFCYNDNHLRKWVITMLSPAEFVRVVNNVLIFETLANEKFLKLHCPNCDHCNFFTFILLKADQSPEKFIQQHKQPKTSDLYAVEILISKYIPSDLKSQHSLKDVLTHVHKYKLHNDANTLIITINGIHILSFLFSKQANMTFSYEGDNNLFQWEKAMLGSCFGKKSIQLYPQLRPLVSQSIKPSFTTHQVLGLVLQRFQHSFVSCHKRQDHWINQLSQLISAFDIYTWLAIWISYMSLACTLNLTRGAIQNQSNSFLFVFSSLLFATIDQSCKLFSSLSYRKKVSSFTGFLLVSVAGMILSNSYKGENITRLTAEPKLLPFDTLDSLLQNNVDIRWRRINSNKWPIFRTNESVNLTKIYGSVKGHESFPIVSELWVALIYRLRPQRANERSLYYLKDEISNQTWKYINNSAMLSDVGQGLGENVQTIVDLHMDKCNKSAIALTNYVALQLYTILKSKGKPAYFGKEIIYENHRGYKFNGIFPAKYIYKATYLFQTGIVNWWRKYFEFAMVLKTSSYIRQKMFSTAKISSTAQNSNQNTAVAVFSVILGTGILISVMVFVFFEIESLQILFLSKLNFNV